jgi:GNAT superfamily N-acetyltransferase
MWKEPEGCLVAEKEGEIIGAAYSHVWGSVGWVGPFEVLPEHQNAGVGSALLEACEDFLRTRGARVIGLETMSHIPKNLHFYLSREYSPSTLTLITDKVLDPGKSKTAADVSGLRDVREAGAGESEKVVATLRRIGASVYPGLDYSCEYEILVEKGLGTVFIWENKGLVDGVALLHTYQKSDDDSYSSVKLLVVDPHSKQAGMGFLALLRRCEDESLSLDKRRMYARFSISGNDLYKTMVGLSYSIKGANVRFVKGAEYRENGLHNLSSWAG